MITVRIFISSASDVAEERTMHGRSSAICAAGDLTVLLAILRGEYHISGLSNRLLQRVLTGKQGGQISRILKRLRLHGLIRKIGPHLQIPRHRLGPTRPHREVECPSDS